PAGLVQAAVRAARRDTVTPDEDRELLYGGLDFEGWCAQDVGTLIRAHAQRPRVPWIFKILRSPARHDVEYVTWRQLMERAGGYARRYRELGLRDGAVVMLVLPQGIELIAAFVGALLVGLVPSICAHPSTKHSREAFAQWFGVVVERSAARLVVTAPRWAELLRDELAR